MELREKNRKQKLWSVVEVQGSAGALPAAFMSHSISGMEARWGAMQHKVNHKSTRALTNLLLAIAETV